MPRWRRAGPERPRGRESTSFGPLRCSSLCRRAARPRRHRVASARGARRRRLTVTLAGRAVSGHRGGGHLDRRRRTHPSSRRGVRPQDRNGAPGDTARPCTTTRRGGHDRREHDALVASIASTLNQLAGTNSSLAATNVHAYLQGAGIATLQTCLGGVQDALVERSAARDNDRRSRTSPPCRDRVHNSRRDGRRTRLSVRLSRSRRHPDRHHLLRLCHELGGREHPDHLVGQLDAVGGRSAMHSPLCPRGPSRIDTWAPSVTESRAPSSCTTPSMWRRRATECVSVATASVPQGPFMDASTAPLECQQSLGGSIDPSAFTDATGPRIWSGNRVVRVRRSSGRSSRTRPARDSPRAHSPTLLLSPDQPWEGGTVEAPDLVLANGGTTSVLLGERLEQRQLRRRRGNVRRAARPVCGRLVGSDLGLRDGNRGPGRGIGVHRHERRALDRVSRVGSGCRGLPQQPRSLHPPAGPLGRSALRRHTRARP